MALRRFERYILVFEKDGKPAGQRILMFGVNFSSAKRIAIECLKERLDASHGRGNHTVTVHGLVDIDVETPERKAVGFPSQWERKADPEVLFKL